MAKTPVLHPVAYSGRNKIRFEEVGVWKYRLVDSFHIDTGLNPGTDLSLCNDLLCLSGSGILSLQEGYAWDGPSGPAIDTPDWMRGSLVHDALYQFMRESLLPLSYRKPADQIMRRLLLADGMPAFRAWYSYVGVRIGGLPSAKPSTPKGPQTAP